MKTSIETEINKLSVLTWTTEQNAELHDILRDLCQEVYEQGEEGTGWATGYELDIRRRLYRFLNRIAMPSCGSCQCVMRPSLESPSIGTKANCLP